jgi:hypothetical protein
MGGDGGGILRHVNPQPPKTHAGFADAKVGRRRQPDTSEGASGRPPMHAVPPMFASVSSLSAVSASPPSTSRGSLRV